jgi:hypothetical protein
MDFLNNIIPEKGIINIINYYKKEFEIVDKWGRAKCFRDEFKVLCDYLNKDLFNLLENNLSKVCIHNIFLGDILIQYGSYYKFNLPNKIIEEIRGKYTRIVPYEGTSRYGTNINRELNEIYYKDLHIFKRLILLSKCIDSLKP